jgi:glutathione S-transferase
VVSGAIAISQRIAFPSWKGGRRLDCLPLRGSLGYCRNERLEKLLANSAEVARHIGEAKALGGRIDNAVAGRLFVAAAHYTLADAYVTAALARFRLHGFEGWWTDSENTNVPSYYKRMQSRSSWGEAGVIDSGSERDL